MQDKTLGVVLPWEDMIVDAAAEMSKAVLAF